jgi:stage II sporulation protein D
MMRAFLPFVLCLVVFSVAVGRTAAENIRVLIVESRQPVTVEAPRGFRSANKPGSGVPASRIIRVSSLPKGRAMRLESMGGVLRVNGRSYRGAVEVRRAAGGKLIVVNDLDIEEYLKGVIPAEVPFDWEEEALKAQAVASRSYALYQKREAGRLPYDIRATVDSQVYLGMRAERERSTRAVEATAGIVVLYAGEIIPAFYHSSCGGHTEDASVLWGLDEPYLKGVDCDCQEISRYGIWEKRFTAASVARALRRQGYPIRDIGSVAIGEMTAAGRVKNVVFGQADRRTSVPAETLRAALGYSQVPSIFFEPELIGGEIVLSGRGLGHGVGLCQWGARFLAQKGFDFTSILAYYYPGTTLGRIEKDRQEVLPEAIVHRGR